MVFDDAQAQAHAQSAGDIQYRLSFNQAAQNYVDVELTIPTAGKGSVELFLPVWTPGSYLVREFARHIEDFRASNNSGQALSWHKTRKNRWKIDCPGQSEIRLNYRVYCRELSVRTSLVESDWALLNGACIFMTEVGAEKRNYKVQLQLPPQWKSSYSGMAKLGEAFVAKSFDELIDCPIVAGNPAHYEFKVDSIPHHLINEGQTNVWDGPKSAADCQKVVEEVKKLWGFLPYAHNAPANYHIFNILGPGGGGLEHHNSTVIMGSRYAQRNRKDYLGWLSLVAHEYFHAWNVKRLRPKALGPFDYENENYTPSLWIAEGFTAYYDDLLVRRAGFSNDTEYLEIFSKHINDLQNIEGRAHQSLSASSYDAWIKFYRPDENSNNSSISYYMKGPIVAFLLDAEIRSRRPDSGGLDEVMRRAYAKYAGTSGYSEPEFRAVVNEVAGADLSGFFAKYVDGHQELDYNLALKTFGLRFKKADSKDADFAWWGADMEVKAGSLNFKNVRKGAPASKAGINADDELIAIDNLRVPPDKEKLEERLKRYRSGQSAKVLLARREKLVTLDVTFASKPPAAWALEINPEADSQASRNLRAWLGPASPEPQKGSKGEAAKP